VVERRACGGAVANPLAAACGAPPPHRECVLGAGGGASAAVAASTLSPLLDLPCAARGRSRRRRAARFPTRWRPAATTAAPPAVVADTRSRWAPSTPSPIRAAVRAGARPARPPMRAAPSAPRAWPPRVGFQWAAPTPPWSTTRTAVASNPHRGGTPHPRPQRLPTRRRAPADARHPPTLFPLLPPLVPFRWFRGGPGAWAR